ncbi:hypothetical protein GOP47_0012380 [Adiantum capillus-veneris]|uniref:Uncharacterized protein n=1 Tax=Adiantum capillus-veneris TaxID=13818 RepID=A0A9D4UQK0_ADICA|nr:hypothetical protein GOP47_0012380 [Adiantum capillus-veneris]
MHLARTPLQTAIASVVFPLTQNNASKQDMTTAPLEAPGSFGLDKIESLSQKDTIQSSGGSMTRRMQSSLDVEMLPLGRKADRIGKRKWPAQKHAKDARNQAQKAALLRAKQAGATGNFKSVNLEFNNFLIPTVAHGGRSLSAK